MKSFTSDKDNFHSVAVYSSPSSEVVEEAVPFLKEESPSPQIPPQGGASPPGSECLSSFNVAHLVLVETSLSDHPCVSSGGILVDLSPRMKSKLSYFSLPVTVRSCP
ncbi:hypothetical protein DSO57_1019266 [Entomophthora muscae]|uniref:Uncharacterized protein n=1 Tax=Entomophthora muscae TaxID=34485 RepID=A0ACC2UQG7_9FUNG|nr:hypothetical protein DSO57_1019266 [Entomophthora muscae]